jgi:DNA end-binding protein Ku
MTDPNWEEQFRQFLRKTGDDFRRAGDEVRAEAQRLLEAAMDPEKQQRVRDRLNELTGWARKTAQGVAGAVEDAAVKAEAALFRGPEKSDEAGGSGGGTRTQSGASTSETAAPAGGARKTAKRARRTSSGSRAKKSAKSGAPAKKTAKRGGSRAKKAAKRGAKKPAKPRNSRAKKASKRKR